MFVGVGDGIIVGVGVSVSGFEGVIGGVMDGVSEIVGVGVIGLPASLALAPPRRTTSS